MEIPKDDKRKNISILYLGNVSISGILRCVSGLHIGSGSDELKIGGIDKFVIKNPMNNKPYIPGSSVKGKMRSLFEKWLGKTSNRGKDKIFRYEADDINDALKCDLSRIFGSTSEGKDKLNFPSRLIVRDFQAKDFKLEKKSENTLDRLSAHANPRTNERVAAGSTFDAKLDYSLEVITDEKKNIYLGDNNRTKIDDYLKDAMSDIRNILNSMMLLELNYLGGNGSRGYGQVILESLTLNVMTIDELLGLSQAVFSKTHPTLKELRSEFDSNVAKVTNKIKTYYETK